MSNAFASWCAGFLLVGCAVAQEQGGLLDRLRDLQKDLASRTSDRAAPLRDEDLDLIESAKIDVSSLTAGDVAMLVKVLRFGAGLGEGDWKPASDYAASEEGRSLARSMMILQVHHGDMDAAARLAIVSLSDAARENRSYSLWKLWDVSYGTRDDAPQLSRDFALALLRRGQSGDEVDKQVVADLFGKEKLTDSVVVELRKQIEQDAERQMVEREQALADSDLGRKIWIEDRKGLRQARRDPSMHIDRWEVRLGVRIGDQAAEPPWGTLISIYDDNLQAELDVLRDLAVEAQEDLTAFDAGVGPIAKIRRPGGGDDPFSWPIHELDDHMTATLAAGGYALLLAGQDIAEGAGHRSVGKELAKQSFAAVRRAAARLRVLTEPGRTEKSLDEAGDEQLMAELDEVTRRTAGWVAKVMTEAPAAADGGSWSDMRRPGPRGMQEATLVQIVGDRVTILVIDSHEGASDVPGIYHGLMVCQVTRDDLRGATFKVDGAATVVIDSAQPPRIRWLSLPPADGTDFQISLVGDSAVRGGRQAVQVSCDTGQHAQDLAEQLRQFAAGHGR